MHRKKGKVPAVSCSIIRQKNIFMHGIFNLVNCYFNNIWKIFQYKLLSFQFYYLTYQPLIPK